MSYTVAMRFLIPFAFLFLTQAAVAQEPLVFVSDAAHAPFTYLDESGEIAGLERDIADAICLVLQRRCDVVLAPWPDLTERVNQGAAELAFTGLSRSTIEHLGMQATAPYLPTPSRFAVLADAAQPESLEALQAFTVGALWGSPHALWLEANLPPEKVQRFPDAEELHLSLHAGTIDLVFGDGLSLYLDFLRSPLGSGVVLSELAIPLETDGEGYAFAMKTGADDLGLISGAILRLQEDGTLARLIGQHLPGY